MTVDIATRKLCTFRVGPLLLGVDVDSVQEVTERLRLTPVPLAGPGLRGVINLRGQILTAVDLRHPLGLAQDTTAADPVDVVLRVRNELVSVLVDEVADVVDVTSDAHPPPPSLAPGLRDLLPFVHAGTGPEPLLELSVEALLAAIRQSSLNFPSERGVPS